MTRKVAFITGASRGIGAETAIALAHAGYDVAITARSLRDGEQHEHGSYQSNTESLPGSLESTADAVRAAGGQALCMRSDILQPDTVLAAIEEALGHYGHIDLLFNNACFQGMGNMQHIMDITAQQIGDIYQGNVFTPLAAVQAVLPGMLDRQSGTIINMVSGSAEIDPPAPAGEGGWGFAYSSSKAALIRMAGVLRVEHKDSNLRFMNVEPGFVVTEVMKANGLSEALADFTDATPAKTVAEVITWLAESTEAHNATVLHIPQLAKKLEAR
jgi:NAD(P)-dependent dehydrogenase (short-subunit alcohol dehydrogenase family)|tara:strand:- start:1613 stop:2428 length:816 start_codon:yes stop_codon:yes gene_type:complete